MASYLSYLCRSFVKTMIPFMKKDKGKKDCADEVQDAFQQQPEDAGKCAEVEEKSAGAAGESSEACDEHSDEPAGQLDETEALGNLYNMKIRTRADMSYITCGQDVPEDIEEFSPQNTVKQLLGGAK